MPSKVSLAPRSNGSDIDVAVSMVSKLSNEYSKVKSVLSTLSFPTTFVTSTLAEVFVRLLVEIVPNVAGVSNRILLEKSE
ncbi:unannotated protein [freshwater metagenome]|uniref:Unannotated protein n=1 Tax=freshwater metagenome TaxID=449393 RepID=A0A6J5ZJR5_9ZZZZ